MYSKNLLKVYEALKPYGAKLTNDLYVGYYFAAGKEHGFNYPGIIIDLTAPEKITSNIVIFNAVDRMNKRSKKCFFVDYTGGYIILADAEIEAAYNAANEERKTFLNTYWNYVHESRINHKHPTASKEEYTEAEAAALAAVDRLKKAREAA